MHNRDRGPLVDTELSHDPVDVVLLEVDVVKDRLPRHPVLMVKRPLIRENLNVIQTSVPRG